GGAARQCVRARTGSASSCSTPKVRDTLSPAPEGKAFRRVTLRKNIRNRANYLVPVKIWAIPAAACVFCTTTGYPAAEDSPFAFHAPRETALLATGLAGHLIGDLRLRRLEPARPDELRRADLPPLDRWNAGTWNPRADALSDLATWGAGGAMLYADLWHVARGAASRRPFLEDALVLAQAFAWNSALNVNVRAARVHPRPFVYGTAAPAAERAKGQAAGSSYSGHAASAFLGAVSVSTVCPLRHPDHAP